MFKKNYIEYNLNNYVAIYKLVTTQWNLKSKHLINLKIKWKISHLKKYIPKYQLQNTERPLLRIYFYNIY